MTGAQLTAPKTRPAGMRCRRLAAALWIAGLSYHNAVYPYSLDHLLSLPLERLLQLEVSYRSPAAWAPAAGRPSGPTPSTGADHAI